MFIIDFYSRTYAIRRTQDGFQQGKTETDPQKIESLIQKAEESLQLLQRQVGKFLSYRKDGGGRAGLSQCGALGEAQ